jgi:hypothetical protein
MRARFTDTDTALQIDIAGLQGQMLVNPVLLDFGKNPLALEVRGNLKGDALKVDSLRLTQTDLIDLTGKGEVNLAGDVPVVDGDFQLTNFEFPAAYSSYMQITLATTSVLSESSTSGSLSGELSVKAMASHLIRAPKISNCTTTRGACS